MITKEEFGTIDRILMNEIMRIRRENPDCTELDLPAVEYSIVKELRSIQNTLSYLNLVYYSKHNNR